MLGGLKISDASTTVRSDWNHRGSDTSSANNSPLRISAVSQLCKTRRTTPVREAGASPPQEGQDHG
ncbi:hypothetical protein CSUI_006738 [Cystoisospora suis]|uniref:Uncharacterized protein n=1 Tax=Cystoisospora suis TaxID=483139 RepID=A0A2C6KTB1_9APIC|nr:hypothetical protein CSUI_006738 [Cystoisospora suis]